MHSISCAAQSLPARPRATLRCLHGAKHHVRCQILCWNFHRHRLQALRCRSTGHFVRRCFLPLRCHRLRSHCHCFWAIGVGPPTSRTSSRRTSRGKCPAAQCPDEGKVQGSKRDHAQESLVAHVEKLCGVNPPLQQQSCSPCSLRGLVPTAAGADSPDAALRG